MNPLAMPQTLRAAGRNPPAPCRVMLDDGRALEIRRWLRVLPKKRLTGEGELEGRPVLAKLFIASRGSDRHWQREKAGVDALVAGGIATPEPVASGALRAGGHYLLTAFLPGARDLTDMPAGRMHEVFALLGHLHAAGLVHHDAHFGNFLEWQGGLWVVDGDAIRTRPARPTLVRNLALLLSQLPAGQDTAALLDAYRHSHPALVVDAAELAAEVFSARRHRLQDYLRKSLRDCTLFKADRDPRRFVVMDRSEAGFLAPVVADPDRWLEAGTPLKRGGTATLAMIEVEGRQLVVKRYNIKSMGHALSRFWRPSRAHRSWIAGQRLRFLGIDTPRPLAMVEQRLGPLRGKAWLITEHCSGRSLLERLGSNTPPAPDVITDVGRLFAQLAQARITHGDLKASNLICHEGGVSLVDLDGLRQHDNDASFRRAWRRDRARLLRNWPADGAIGRALDAALPPA